MHPARDPRPRRGEEKRPLRVDVVTERALDGDEAVAGKPARRASRTLRGRGGDGVEGDSRGSGSGCRVSPRCAKRSSPSQSSSSRLPWRRSVIPALRIFPSRANGSEYGLTPRAAWTRFPPRSSGEPWCGVPRKTTDAQASRPGVPGLGRVVEGAARHEAAHAVGHDRQRPAAGAGPLARNVSRSRDELATVRRDVTAGVVAEVDRRQAEVALERHAVVVPLAAPSGVVHAEAVNEEDEPSRRLRDDGGESPRVRLEGLAVPPQVHRDRERVAARLEVVAQDPVERREERVAAGRGLQLAEERRELREGGVDAAPDEPGHAADVAVDDAREPVVGPAGGVPSGPGAAEIVWCTASTSSVTPSVASAASLPRPRRWPDRVWGVFVIGSPLESGRRVPRRLAQAGRAAAPRSRREERARREEKREPSRGCR